MAFDANLGFWTFMVCSFNVSSVDDDLIAVPRLDGCTKRRTTLMVDSDFDFTTAAVTLGIGLVSLVSQFPRPGTAFLTNRAHALKARGVDGWFPPVMGNHRPKVVNNVQA